MIFRFKKGEKSRGGTNFTDLYNKKTSSKVPFQGQRLWLLNFRKVEGSWSKIWSCLVIQPLFSQMPPWDLGIFESYMKTHKIGVNMYGKYSSPNGSTWVFESLKNFWATHTSEFSNPHPEFLGNFCHEELVFGGTNQKKNWKKHSIGSMDVYCLPTSLLWT